MIETPVNDSLYGNEFLATKTKEQLDSEYAKKDVVYKAICHNDGKYNWKVIKSQYSDNSNLGFYYMTFDTLAGAISQMINDGFIVTKNGILIKPLKIKS